MAINSGKAIVCSRDCLPLARSPRPSDCSGLEFAALNLLSELQRDSLQLSAGALREDSVEDSADHNLWLFICVHGAL